MLKKLPVFIVFHYYWLSRKPFVKCLQELVTTRKLCARERKNAQGHVRRSLGLIAIRNFVGIIAQITHNDS